MKTHMHRRRGGREQLGENMHAQEERWQEQLDGNTHTRVYTHSKWRGKQISGGKVKWKDKNGG